MTPEQITLVQSSFDRLGPDLPELATHFYQELFARDPGLRPLFATDFELQKVRFADKLTEIVRSIPRLTELLGHTRALGARHVGYGVHVADYRTVGDALLASPPCWAIPSTPRPARPGWPPTIWWPKRCSKAPHRKIALLEDLVHDSKPVRRAPRR
jgi:hypothetical protein